MNIRELARRDTQDILTNGNDFAESVTLVDTAGNNLVINALFTIHHTAFDPETNATVNSLNGSVAVSENVLISNYYNYIDDNGDVSFYGHNIKVTQSNGTTKTYRIEQWFPDKTLGLIVLILGNYAKTV